MSALYQAGITGLGAYLPAKVLTNFDLEKMVDTTDDWIRTRTGIRERRIAAKGQKSSDLGLEAAKQALQNAGLKPADLELIIVATITPDMLFPSTACSIQARLGAACGAFDMAAACSGFPYALAVSEGLVKAGLYKHILVVGAEMLSSFIDWKDRATCVLFGDGAGAAVVSRLDHDSGHGVIASYLGSDGNQADILQIPGGGSAHPPSEETLKQGLHFLKMQGAEVFKVAVRTMEDAVHEVLRRADLELKDVDWLIPHQANIRILNAVAERLELPPEKVYINVDRYGNMSSASTVVALCEAVSQGLVKKGQIIVLVAFGGGLTWAANVIKW
ncbi:MAG: ketoacyl-ACP synthase III [Candidatus Omnitrophica bacterium]|nr:ketoacyl-ACP synthase III [Candidatus Omnitrophota bacterium]MDD5670648.1 ketoacyl-ACP synthase III [Candidatus Omnitrophota bacterium]